MSSKQLDITKEQLEKWQSSLSYKFTRWFQYTWFGSLWYNIKGGIPSLFKWIKIAWNDRDWDYRYIYDSLRFKLENTANYIEKYERSVDYKEDVRWMRICVNLIDKLKDEFYSCEYLDYKKTKFRFEKIKGTDLSELHSDVIEDNLDNYLNKYPLSKKRAIEHIKKNSHRYTSDHNDTDLVSHVMARQRHDKARKLLFSIIENKIESWWD